MQAKIEKKADSEESPHDIDTPEQAYRKEKLASQCQEYVDSLYPIVNELYSDQVKWLLTNVNIDASRPTKLGAGTMYLIYINEEGRRLLKIDDVLAYYLIDVAEQVKPHFYKMVACFI